MPTHIKSAHSTTAVATSGRGRSTDQGRSLADLYNSRHAQESASRLARQSTSIPLADLYNQRYEAEQRKGQQQKQAPGSLAALYNRRYESERQASTSTSAPFGTSAIAGPSTRRTRIETNRATEVVDSSDESTPEPLPFAASPSVGSVDEGEDDWRSGPAYSDRDRSRTPSDSLLDLSSSHRPQVVYVDRSALPRRGALGASATRLSIDSDEESDLLGTPDPEDPSLAAIGRSGGNAETDPDRGTSTPPVPPLHRGSPRFQQRMPSSTEASEPMSSSPRSTSASQPKALEQRRASDFGSDPRFLDEPMPDPAHVAPSDNPIVACDSAFDENTANLASTRFSSLEDDRGSTRSSLAEWNAVAGEPVVLLTSPSKRMHEEVAEEYGSQTSRAQSLPPTLQSSHVGEIAHSEQNPDAHSDADSDTPVVTSARIVDIREDDASGATRHGNVSDSEGQRRYPKRPRNVTDYNIIRAFERYEQAQGFDAPKTSAPVPVKGPKKVLLPVVTASSSFLEKLRAGTSNKTSGGSQEPLSFADYLMAKAQSGSADAIGETSVGITTRSADASKRLTNSQARALLNCKLGPAPLWDVSASKDVGPSLNQHRPSLRRWVGNYANANESGNDIVSERSVSGTPLNLTLRSLITSRLNGPPHPAELHQAFQSLGTKSLIGRPRDADTLESASRHLRFGRAYKLPLPLSLQPIADMEHAEWVRNEEFLLEIDGMNEEWKAREQGKIMVEMDSEYSQTQYNRLGRKKWTTLQCTAGGVMKIYYRMDQSDEVGSAGEEEPDRIVARQLSAESPLGSRFASAQPVPDSSDEEPIQIEAGTAGSPPTRSDDEDSDLHIGTGEVAADSSDPALPFAELDREERTPPRRLDFHEKEGGPAAKGVHTSLFRHRAKAQPRPVSTTQRDLRSYFTVQPGPGQSRSMPAPAAAAHSARSREKALGQEIKAWPSSLRSTEMDMEVVVDLTHSPSATERVAPSSKRPRSPSPSPSLLALMETAGSSNKAQKTVGKGRASSSDDPFLRAEARRREVRQRVRDDGFGAAQMDSRRTKTSSRGVAVARKRNVETVPSAHGDSRHSRVVGTPPPPARRVISSKALIPSRAAAGSGPVAGRSMRIPPASTPSPTKGGWKGVSAWYTNTREAFSPTGTSDRHKRR